MDTPTKTYGLGQSPAPPERLAALRAELSERGLDGFVVPRADEHQGEYVPPRAQRLAWLTGFTGSAGTAVVLTETAAVFVDGRYVLQAEQEVDGDRFARVHSGTETPSDWLARSLTPGAKLGYDPWLHTPDDVARLERACRRAGAALVAVDANPVDAVWQDRPPPPVAAVRPHPIEFAGVDSPEKRRALAADLRGEGLDAAVLTDPSSLAWLFNIRGGDVRFTPLPLGFAILTADGTATLFLDPAKVQPGLAEHLGSDVRLAPPAGLGPALDALGANGLAVRVDGSGSPAWVHVRLAAAGARVDPGPDPCALPRACKNDVELAGTRAAHRRDGRALVRFLAWLDRRLEAGERVTELAASDRLEAFRRDGSLFQDLSFPTISGAGADGAIVHYRVTEETDRPLTPGELFLVDSGAQYLDGTTDVTRTVFVPPGTPTAEQRRRFTQVLKGHIALARAVFPAGTRGGQLDVLARRFLWEDGADYDHGTGHGVGSYLGVHEGPQRIAKGALGAELRPGMIVSNEPGYYKGGAFGIRIENLVAVRPLPRPSGGDRDLMGFETLTLAPIDRRLVDLGLMDEGERAWLDGYHDAVRTAHAADLDADTRTWLEAATAPL